MCVNTNILTDNPIASKYYTVCPGYEGLAAIGTISSSTATSSIKNIFVRLNIWGKPTGYSPLFVYHLEGVENNNGVLNELDVHKMTSWSSNAPSSELLTNDSNITLKKSIYALGDVDRDGDVDNDDVAAVQKYVAGLCKGAVGRTEEESVYDKAVFLLAADFNRDGIVDMSDAVGILQYYQKNNK